MMRRIVSNPEQSVADVTDLPIKTSDLNRVEIARISGTDGCFPVPEDDTSEDFDPTLEDILGDVDPFDPWSWPM
ncbi:MAG: hypothetical protein J4F29_16540 [Candidatus Latescibacteria bacterium]|nr:hypothetical protein [Candidatus Latescibacterota bacterium]